MWCLAHKLANSSENVFVDVSVAQMIEKQLFNSLGPGILVNLNMPKNMFMSD